MMTRTQAAAQAAKAAKRAVPRVSFRATVFADDILDVDCGERLTTRESAALERAVSALGWRAVGVGWTGIAFKPTSVDMA